MRCVSALPPAPSTVRGTSVSVSAKADGSLVAYGSGRYVVLRALDTTTQPSLFAKHSANVTAVAIAPGGFLCASGDASGNIMIWTMKADNMVVTYETKALGGAVKDIAWSHDDERIVVVGDGRDVMGVVISAKAGNSLGSITGHTKAIYTCDFRKDRPFRIVTGAGDSAVNFFEGPPFKLAQQTNGEHSAAVTCARFAPNHGLIASVSGAAGVLLQDGKTGEKIRKIDTDHKGTIYSVAWSPDSSRVATASADKSVRLWRVDDGTSVGTMSFGTALSSMQLCVCYAGPDLVSVSLGGVMTVLADDGSVANVISGHNHNVKGLGVCTNGSILSAAADGRMLSWLPGRHATAPTGASTDFIKACAFDGSALYALTSDAVLRCDGETVTSVCSVSKAVAIAALSAQVQVVICAKSAMLHVDGKVVATVPIEGMDAQCAAATAGHVAVGGTTGAILLKVSRASLDVVHRFTHRTAVCCIALSSDVTRLALGDDTRTVAVFDCASGAATHPDLTYHASQVTCVAFAPGDAAIMATGSVDRSVITWNLAKNERKIHDNVHFGGVAAVAFSPSGDIVSAGADCAVRVWAP